MVWKSTQLTSNAFEDYMTCLLQQDFEPHFPVRLRGQWHPSEAGCCLWGWPCGAQNIEGTRVFEDSVFNLRASFSFSSPRLALSGKEARDTKEKTMEWESATLAFYAALHFHLICPHAGPLILLNWFLLCHIGITSSGLPSRKGCEFHARCLCESALYASQM